VTHPVTVNIMTDNKNSQSSLKCSVETKLIYNSWTDFYICYSI